MLKHLVEISTSFALMCVGGFVWWLLFGVAFTRSLWGFCFALLFPIGWFSFVEVRQALKSKNIKDGTNDHA